MFEEVYSYPTCFQTSESITLLKTKIDLTISNDYELLIVQPCSLDERVFLKASKNEFDFVYLYEDVFKELHVSTSLF